MKKSVMGGIIAVLLAGILTLTAGIGSSWFTNGNIGTWFNSWGKGKQEIVQPDTPDIGGGNTAGAGGAILTESESRGISVLSAELPVSAYEANGIDPQADTAYLLTATIIPSTADNQAVDWSIFWKNPSSTWASGKAVTDYVTITPTSDGALTANVVCKRSFGEQIQIMVQSRINNSATAICNVDYTKKISRINGTFVTNGLDLVSGVEFDTNNSVQEWSYSTNGGSGKTVYTPDNKNAGTVTYTDYTLEDTFHFTYTVEQTQAYTDALNAKGGLLGVKRYNTITIKNGVCESYTLATGGLFCVTCASDTVPESVADWNFWYDVCNPAVEVLKENAGMHFMKITVTATGNHSAFTKTIEYVANQNSLIIVATGVALSKSDLLF